MSFWVGTIPQHSGPWCHDLISKESGARICEVLTATADSQRRLNFEAPSEAEEASLYLKFGFQSPMLMRELLSYITRV